MFVCVSESAQAGERGGWAVVGRFERRDAVRCMEANERKWRISKRLKWWVCVCLFPVVWCIFTSWLHPIHLFKGRRRYRVVSFAPHPNPVAKLQHFGLFHSCVPFIFVSHFCVCTFSNCFSTGFGAHCMFAVVRPAVSAYICVCACASFGWKRRNMCEMNEQKIEKSAANCWKESRNKNKMNSTSTNDRRE